MRFLHDAAPIGIEMKSAASREPIAVSCSREPSSTTAPPLQRKLRLGEMTRRHPHLSLALVGRGSDGPDSGTWG
jgi:hypothetical protein